MLQWVRAGDAPFEALALLICCRCHWESRPQEGGGIAQAWATWPEGASAPNGTMMCRGHGVPEMVTHGNEDNMQFLIGII